ncbi:MAG: hypothetical protein A3C61_01555 [Candidatus Yanofskybacteria bacterium RIFCSPHIGHO2_02_FULL_39_10]|uniref:Uncharacterized protein n=1 Tax=Candidatus Yanofskybacteria bacterium RIFCSPHIGHO2_02_FULL_39_10 TaxID=1802674 RepID=A0A1F8F824_9BACT|nr:MAG: hypothetical protein A3C61_01555 [Candidatus Yanofskybacteria bacterium RIFCSPHIGHO2_02_FULL_39_10]
MENPFKKFFHEDSELAPPRRMEPEEKAKRLAELKEWKRQVEVGASMERVPDDMEQIDKIDEEIRRLEQE